jgi:hypothetical protein
MVKQQQGKSFSDPSSTRDHLLIMSLASSLAAMRKSNDAAQPKPLISTPQEFSRLKYDRECKMVERQEQYRLQVLAHQRV